MIDRGEDVTLDRMARFLAPPATGESSRTGSPSFSVLIPAYQAAATIGEAIASAREQTVPPTEILVCDDGSTDGLEAALAPHRDAIRLLRQENRGATAARNALLGVASGDFVAPLD